MEKKNGSKKKTIMSNGLRDYSHLPRAKDFKPSESLSKEMQELKQATKEALEALEDEQRKYGLRDYSHLPRAKDFKTTPLKEMSPEMREAVLAGREAIKAIGEAFDKGEIPNV